MSTNKFYSEDFKLENQAAHQTHRNYGSVSGYVFYFGGEHLSLMGQSVLTMIRTLKPRTVLDYGCGKGLGADNLVFNYPDLQVTKYDPFVPEYAGAPQGQFDMVICYNVLQVIESQYLDQVIEDCVRLSTQHVLFNILYHDKSLKNLDWWAKKLSRHPVIDQGSSVAKKSHDRFGETLDAVNLSFWIKK
jgi:hypothetical protein